MDIAHIRVGNPVFDMEGDTGAYLLVDDQIALVDAGVATTETRRELVTGLATHDLSLADVDHLLLTHWHPDHAGLAGTVQDASGASVHVHEADAPIVAGAGEGLAELAGSRHEALRTWGLPANVREAVADRLATGDGPRGFADESPTIEPIADGAEVGLGSHTLRALHTPGHTAGETCYVLERNDRREVFTGDALLPDYTANVGGADPRAEGALSAHLESLQALVQGGFDQAFPGHGDSIVDPASRARTVLAHHRERAGHLLVIAREPTTVWEAATELFGDLASVHLMLGLGETYAHLEHMRHAGLVTRTDGRYKTVAGQPGALDGAFPEVEA